MSSNLAATPDSEPLVKRRRLRKGTHSCWQCKKRKVKCIPDPLADGGPCDECRRRGSRCVGQECPEDGPLTSAPTPNPDHAAVGTTVTVSRQSFREATGLAFNQSSERSGQTTPAKASPCDQSIHRNVLTTPASTVSSPSLAYFKTHEVSAPLSCARVTAPEAVTAHVVDCFLQRRVIENDTLAPTPKSLVSEEHAQQVCHGKSETLSQYLHRSLPSREDTERICTASQHKSVLAHEIMTMPYTTLSEKGLKTPETLLEIPSRDQHPVLIARHMLLLATFLQRKKTLTTSSYPFGTLCLPAFRPSHCLHLETILSFGL